MINGLVLSDQHGNQITAVKVPLEKEDKLRWQMGIKKLFDLLENETPKAESGQSGGGNGE